jgi:hypothetical protein
MSNLFVVTKLAMATICTLPSILLWWISMVVRGESKGENES